MSRRSSTAAALVALVATVAAACTAGAGGPSPTISPSPSPSPEAVPVKIAFLHDSSVPGSAQIVAPSLLGLQLAMGEAVARGGLPVIPQVVSLDTEGDVAQATELAHQVADDPTFVAAVIGPFWSEPPAVGDVLNTAGIPTLSLSDLDPSLASSGWASWRRVVAGLPRQAAALTAAIAGSPHSQSGVCLVGDGSIGAGTLADLLPESLGSVGATASLSLPDEAALGVVVERIGRIGCGTVAWTGFGPGAILLRTGLTEAGLASVPVVGSDAMKTDAFLATTAGAGDGTLVTCGCVDLASSTRPEARRFIHDFQSQYGSAPGVFGAEGWDVGGMLLGAFRAGGVDRRTVSAALSTSDAYEGLANRYRFADDGELAPGAARIHLFRAEGVRWVPLGETESDEPLPVRTPGYLSMSSCRKGRPFAYVSGGRQLGFDVELATAIARRLGLTLAWRDLSCDTTLQAVADGALDAALVPATDVTQGTPASGIALSVHVALVVEGSKPDGEQAFLERLGPQDVVAVVPAPEAVAWARDAIRATGARVRVITDRASAYRRLVAGRVTAVADLEPEAWAAIERRPFLSVAQGVDVGAHDVFLAKGPDAVLVAAIDQSLARLIRNGRYTLVFAKYFPGTPIPSETGS